MVVTQPWYKEYFGEDYITMYQYANSIERTQRDVKGIVQILNLPYQSKILDLCCGFGRHSIELARIGYNVTGFDLSNVLLNKAITDANSSSIQVDWIQGDMRDLPFDSEFDAVINVFNSFGFLECDEEDQKVLAQVRKVLKPGGLFLQEYANLFAFIHNDLKQHRTSTLANGKVIEEKREFDLLASRLHTQTTIIDNDGQRRYSEYNMRLYSPSELIKMLKLEGFWLEKSFGGLDCSELTIDSVFLVTLNRLAKNLSINKGRIGKNGS